MGKNKSASIKAAEHASKPTPKPNLNTPLLGPYKSGQTPRRNVHVATSSLKGIKKSVSSTPSLGGKYSKTRRRSKNKRAKTKKILIIIH